MHVPCQIASISRPQNEIFTIQAYSDEISGVNYRILF